MATITVRDLQEDLVERLKEAAAAHGRSMEQEVRELLESRYAPRHEVISRLKSRWSDLPKTSAKDVKGWRETGRK